MNLRKIILGAAALAVPTILTINPIHHNKSVKLLAKPSVKAHSNILNIVQYQANRVSAFAEAKQLHGSIMDNCAYYVSSLLRTDGYNVPFYTGSVSGLRNWTSQNGWASHTDLENLEPGDICFAGNSHTFIFVSWYNKAKGLANVNDNQIAYFNPNKATYVRDLNGSTGGNYLPGCGYDNSYEGVTSFVTPPYAGSIGRVSTKDIDLHMRDSIDGKLIGRIPNNTRLNLLSSKDGWYKVSYNGKTGWVAGWYISKS